MKCWTSTVFGIATLTVLAMAAPPAATTAAAADTARDQERAELDANQIVPCLLPGRVRRLGRMTYPERRQLVHTTVQRCELRGGEYTAYDRSDPRTAAAFFQPLADEGDAEAQLRLGEVYEYLFDEPRYADAAAWYRRAVAQGNRTAMRRLAHLHEHGLGVAADRLEATNLWRQAIGSDDTLVLASEVEAVRTAAQQRVDALLQELAARTYEAETLRDDVRAGQLALQVRRAELARARADRTALENELADARTGAPDAQESIAALDRELRERERRLEEQSFQIASLETTLVAQSAALAANARQLELETERLERELARVSEQSESELAEQRAAMDAKTRELAALQAEQRTLTARLDTQSLTEVELAEARSAIETLAARVANAERESAALRGQLDSALDERRRFEADLASAELRLAAAEQRWAATESQLTLSRSELDAAHAERQALQRSLEGMPPREADEIERLRRALAERDHQIDVQTARLETLQREADSLREEAESLRGHWSVRVASRGIIEPLPDTSAIRIPRGVPIGRYHALIIGNNNYANLPSLQFAHNDAMAMHDMLSDQYGFESELVLDATRADVFRRIEALDARMRPDDALLIYYAGHGVEDRRVSYWLGVDAPSTRGSLQTYGVSSSELAQWLAVLSARHVLVIADSCYSGAGIETTGGMKFNVADVEQQLKFYLQNRSRTTLTSGGNVPVPDGGAGEHSVFTRALLSLLEENRGVLFDADIYARIKERVRFGENTVIGVPTPVFGRIEVGGHGAGQFVFMRPGLVRS
jgi:hypothetical protein